MAEGAERDGLQAEAGQMRVRLRELQEVTERQGAALEGKQEELTQLRLRLARMQAEAERSERHVLDLETRLRRFRALRTRALHTRAQLNATPPLLFIFPCAFS